MGDADIPLLVYAPINRFGEPIPPIVDSVAEGVDPVTLDPSLVGGVVDHIMFVSRSFARYRQPSSANRGFQSRRPLAQSRRF